MEYVDGEYVITNPITDKNLKEMRNNMNEADVEEFDKFVERHWGSKMQAKNAEEDTQKRRGRKPANK